MEKDMTKLTGKAKDAGRVHPKPQRKMRMLRREGEIRAIDVDCIDTTISVNGTVVDCDLINNRDYERALSMGLLYLHNTGQIDLKRITKS
jgi:hypothetical protein